MLFDAMTRRTALVVLPLAALLATGGFAQTKRNAPLRAPDIHWEPSTDEQTREMLKLAGVTKNDTVYDLGCGDGKVVIMAAKEFGAKGVGIDIDPQRINESEANAKKAGVTNLVKFRLEDLFEADIKGATVVTLYLWPSVNLKLRPKLQAELKPGTRVVSNLHDMGDWAPDKTIKVDGHPLYLWTIPAKGSAK
jgi:SAM-dependent methyltransferase